jgi:hypothetical protein
MFQLSPTEASSRVRAAVAVGPRTSMFGERLEPVLPKLAALQRDGAVTTEKVQIVERAMLLSRPGLRVEDVETAEQLLSDYASASDTSNTTPRSTRAPKGQQRDYCGLADIRQAVGPGWRGLRTDRQYADQPD